MPLANKTKEVGMRKTSFCRRLSALVESDQPSKGVRERLLRSRRSVIYAAELFAKKDGVPLKAVERVQELEDETLCLRKV